MIAAVMAAISKAARLDLRPTISDPVVMAMRPQGRLLAQLTVSKTNPDADFSTIHEANAAAVAIRDAKMDRDHAPRRTWNHRVDIIIDPGVYEDDYIRDFDSIAFYAADGGHSSVQIKAPTGRDAVAASAFEPHGFTYCEGISIETRTMDDGKAGYKYPLHLGQIKVFVWTRGSLLAHDSNALGSGAAIGTDGGSNATIVLHDVRLDGGTNQHGWDSTTMPDPLDIVYSYVTQTGPPDAGIGYGALTDLRADRFWAANSRAVRGIGAAGAMVVKHVYNCDPGTGTITANDNRSDWPIPYGGYSNYYRATYGLPAYVGNRPWESSP